MLLSRVQTCFQIIVNLKSNLNKHKPNTTQHKWLEQSCSSPARTALLVT